MRTAFILSPSYQQRPEIGLVPVSAASAQAMRDRLGGRGFDFRVVDLPTVDGPQGWLQPVLSQFSFGADDVVVVYVSAVVHLDDAGDVALEIDRPALADDSLRTRVSLARMRLALSEVGIKGALLVLDLVHHGGDDPALAAEHVAAVRRVFAPELSGYSMLCAMRSLEKAKAERVGPAPFTSLFLKTLARTDVRNGAGAVLASSLMEALREDPDLYTDVPCFALVAGRRNLTLYSATAVRPECEPAAVPAAAPAAEPRAALSVDEVLAEAEQHYARGAWETAGECYKRALLMLGQQKTSQRASAYVRLADIRASQGRRREAAISYRKAIDIDPHHAEALRSLAELLRADGDFAQAATVTRQLLEATQPDDKFAVLLVLAEDCDKARQVEEAIATLEQARGIRPGDAVVLARLAQLYDATHAFDKVVDIKIALAKLKPQAEEVARSLVLAADFALDRAHDKPRARAIYAQALDADPMTPRAFDAIATLLDEAHDASGYEQELLAQTQRLGKVGAHAAEAEAWRELAAVRNDHLHDLRGAIEALDRCIDLVPADVEGRVTLAELLAQAGELTPAIRSLEIAAVHAPGRAETYRLLHQLCVRDGRTEQAFLAASVLVHLGEADLDEQLYFDQFRDQGPVRPSRSLNDETWQLLYPPGHDANVRGVLALVAPVAIEYRLEQLRTRGMLPKLDPATRQDPQTSTVSLTRTFVWACKVLDVPLPDIYVGDEVPGGIAAVPAEMPSAMVGKSVLSGRSLKELAFLVGRDVTYYRPEHYVLVLYPSLQDLTGVFLAAVRAVRPKLAVPEQGRRDILALASLIESRLNESEMQQLSELVQRFDASGGRVDLVSWAQSIELTATRCGFVLCGDLDVCSQALGKDERAVAELAAVDRMNDLVPFAASEAYVKVREALGLKNPGA